MAVTQLPGKQIGPLDLTTEVTGILPIANGGTGVATGSIAGTLLPVQAHTDGSETYTIASGSVTQIAGTTIQTGGPYSPAVGDRILIATAPASTGAGTFSLLSTQPGNGIYVVTSNTTNLSLSRASDMSGSINPAGLSVYSESATVTWQKQDVWTVTTPSSPAAFTYGTGNITWGCTGGLNPIFNSAFLSNSSNQLGMWNGTAVTTLSTASTATQTLTLPAGTGTLVSSSDGLIHAVDIPDGITNGNSARQSQVTAANTSYYITNSNLNLPATLKTGMAVGTKFVWTVAMDKTAAGTGTFSIVIYRGTNGSTSDTADVTQSIGTQTAAVDNMTVDVIVVVTATGATGSYYWTIVPNNKAITATGFGVATGTGAYFSGTVSSVAMNTASLKFGLGFRNGSPGTPTITVPLVKAQAFNIS